MNLTEELQAVIANLEAREWIQGAEKRGEAVCAHGAVMTCQGLRPGDQHIIRAVMRTKGLTEAWNDEDGRTKGEVLVKLASIAGISDADLLETFGPSWQLMVAVIRRAATISAEEMDRLAAAWDAARDAAWDAAWAAAWAAVTADLVGQHGYTQAHHDLLMTPWTQALGEDWAVSK